MVLQTLKGMQDDAVGSAAATLLHQLLLHLKDDLLKSTGQAVQHPHQCNVPLTCCVWYSILVAYITPNVPLTCYVWYTILVAYVTPNVPLTCYVWYSILVAYITPNPQNLIFNPEL